MREIFESEILLSTIKQTQHNTFIRIFQTADDNQVKDKAIQARYNALAYQEQMM